MKHLDIFDPSMCCSTGVCGPSVNPELIRFAADLKYLQEHGVEVRRYNLAQAPAVFVENQLVNAILTEKGEKGLPILLLDGKILASGRYPDHDEMIRVAVVQENTQSIINPAVKELIAIGAAISANCEPCLKYHYREAQLLGVTKADMAVAVQIAARVKESPHQSILRLADKLTESKLRDSAAAASDLCCGAQNTDGSKPAKSCCS